MAKPKVIIAGGGVGGLSAAHELVNRGFDVEVYEYHDIPGGKARSLGIPGSGKDGRHDLPAEHGFRFFPGYYRHVIDTMKHIPYWKQDTAEADDKKKIRETVYDCLTGVDKEALTSFMTRAIVTPAKMPGNFWGYIKLWRQMKSQPRVNLEKGERRFYVKRLWQIVTSCNERRDDQYEQIPWWKFVGAENRSVNYQNYLANISRTLVAADPKKVSTRTNGNVWVQTLMGMWSPDGDRVLDGPTNEVWIYPWLHYLIGKGVRYYINAEATEYKISGNEIDGLVVRPVNNPRRGALNTQMARVLQCDRYGITETEAVTEPEIHASGDYYIAAVPVERMAEIIEKESKAKGHSELLKLDPQLVNIEQLSYSVQWMNGIQFYLKPSPGQYQPAYLPGHHIHVDAPYALTSIFQTHYWQDVDLANYGNGTVNAICSVDISDWNDAHGRIYDLPAMNLTRTQVFEEVWTDIKTSFRHDPMAAITDENLVDWNLDADISEHDGSILDNREPLLVNRVNTWRLRPTADSQIPNLFFASDYVQTNTDLATMEGANEAARRAVNAILDREKSDQPHCRLWEMQEPEALKPFKAYDLEQYQIGKEWTNKFPWRMKLGFFWFVFKSMFGLGKKS